MTQRRCSFPIFSNISIKSRYPENPSRSAISYFILPVILSFYQRSMIFIREKTRTCRHRILPCHSTFHISSCSSIISVGRQIVLTQPLFQVTDKRLTATVPLALPLRHNGVVEIGNIETDVSVLGIYPIDGRQNGFRVLFDKGMFPWSES